LTNIQTYDIIITERGKQTQDKEERKMKEFKGLGFTEALELAKSQGRKIFTVYDTHDEDDTPYIEMSTIDYEGEEDPDYDSFWDDFDAVSLNWDDGIENGATSWEYYCNY
jgi:hypothetical protein